MTRYHHNVFLARFSSLAEQFKDLHLGDFSNEYLGNSDERLSPTAKRIAEGWLQYSFIELKQRYDISGLFC